MVFVLSPLLTYFCISCQASPLTHTRGGVVNGWNSRVTSSRSWIYNQPGLGSDDCYTTLLFFLA
uniref:Secreted protein n=1 Tax=Picea glauca TaxID=3330 RepID=A0A117NG92_PICGL|nr:hypothetical protein ABT39_MTgene1546 [Picea glauca]QHR87827.1 hypothetical protein Q903MT_gene1839 [Picea sitchensis]